jgi:hypothetical protein
MADDKQRPDEGASGESPGLEPAAAGPSTEDTATVTNTATVGRTAADASDQAAKDADDRDEPDTSESAEGASDMVPSLAPGASERVAPPTHRRTPWAALFVCGLLGGSVAVAAAAYLWSTYMADEGVINVVLARLGAVELAVRDLNTRGPQAQGERVNVEELAARLAKVEAAVAAAPGSRGSAATTQPPENPLVTPDPALAERVVGLEALVKSLAEAVSRVEKRSDETASGMQEVRARVEAASQAAAAPAGAASSEAAVVGKAEFDALAARVAAMQEAAASLQQSLDKTAASVQQATARGAEAAAADRAIRLALIVSGLRSAVDRGLPFASELKAAKALMPNPQALAPLEPFAASGVPTVEALGRELAALVPELAQTGDSSARDGSYLERLQSHAERLVRIRPVNGAAGGDDVAAVVARIEANAKQADIAGAVMELRKLPEPARVRAAAWLNKAEARQAAVAAVQRVENSALAALANP